MFTSCGSVVVIQDAGTRLKASLPILYFSPSYSPPQRKPKMRSHSSQSSASAHTWEPRKIWRIARGVKDAKRVDLPSFLNALLAQQLLHADKTVSQKSSYPEKIRQSKTLLDTMLREAEDFCADESNQRSINMRRHIHDWCVSRTVTISPIYLGAHPWLFSLRHETDKEENHPSSLSIALNIILLEFRTRQFGVLPVPSERSDGEELIFISNHQLLPESDRLRKHLSKSKRIPDIVATFTSTLHGVCSNSKESGFDDLIAGHGFTGSSFEKLKWVDTLQTWELEMSTRDVLGVPFSESQNVETHSTKKSVDSSVPRCKNGLKRASDEEEHAQRKRARVCSQSGTERRPFQVVDDQGNLLPELRGAYYATERLSAGWYISHSTAVLLEGVPS